MKRFFNRLRSSHRRRERPALPPVVDSIRSSDPTLADQLVGSAPADLRRLEAEFGELPTSLRDYLRSTVPTTLLELQRVGNPVTLLPASALGREQRGYSVDATSGERLDDWQDNWFLVADEGEDPIVVDTSTGTVLQSMHGYGAWDFDPVAGSMAELILCGAAVQHALNAFEDEPILDDELGFRLAPKAAAWLYPRLRDWAGIHKGHWVGVFDDLPD